MTTPFSSDFSEEIDVDMFLAGEATNTSNTVEVMMGVGVDGGDDDGQLEEKKKKNPTTKTIPQKKIIEVTDLSNCKGTTLGDQVDSFIGQHDVVIIAKSTCPFCRDVLDLLTNQLGVTVHVINVDTYPKSSGSGGGSAIHKHIQEKYKHATVPVVFVRNTYVGGCDDVKALKASGTLERETLAGLKQKLVKMVISVRLI